MHCHARFIARTVDPEWTSQFGELGLDVAATLPDFRGGTAALAPVIDSNNYDKAQSSPHRSGRARCTILGYPSQRDPGGQFAGLLYPDPAANLTQGRHLDYHRKGASVDLYPHAGGGEVYRVN